MSTPSSILDTELLPEQETLLRQLAVTLETEPTSETTRVFHARALALLQPQGPQTPETIREPVNEYVGLATEHAELILSGKTSLEIAGWLGEKLGITSWKAGAFHGERKVLSTPTAGEMVRLQEFTKALGKSWTKANGGSDNYPQFLLLDGYIQNALFGEANMTQVNARFNTFHTNWQKMGRDFTAKAKYLKEKVGLDIRDDWSKLTGVRYDDGCFDHSGSLHASGSFDGRSVRSVRRMWLSRDDSDVDLYHAFGARLCFLA